MKMAINVNEYGTGGRCVYMFKYTYAGIRIVNTQIGKEDRHISRVIHITRAQCQSYISNSQEKKKKYKKVVTNTKVSTNHAALATQVERQIEKKAYTNDNVDCFCYHSWRNNVVIAFGTLSSFLTWLQ